MSNGVKRLKLTDLVVGRLRPGTYWDLLLPAFGVRVGATARTWIVSIRRPGKRNPVRLKLGRFPSMGVGEARAKARTMMIDGPEQLDGTPW